MKKTILAAVAAFALIGGAHAAAPKPPKELMDVRAALVKAIKAKDWKSVAALTNWPLAVESYEAPPKITKAEFQKSSRMLFIYFGEGDADLLKCVGTAPITIQGDKTQFGHGDWIVDCNGNEYLFGQRGGKWLFTGYQNINE